MKSTFEALVPRFATSMASFEPGAKVKVLGEWSDGYWMALNGEEFNVFTDYPGIQAGDTVYVDEIDADCDVKVRFRY